MRLISLLLSFLTTRAESSILTQASICLTHDESSCVKSRQIFCRYIRKNRIGQKHCMERLTSYLSFWRTRIRFSRGRPSCPRWRSRISITWRRRYNWRRPSIRCQRATSSRSAFWLAAFTTLAGRWYKQLTIQATIQKNLTRFCIVLRWLQFVYVARLELSIMSRGLVAAQKYSALIMMLLLYAPQTCNCVVRLRQTVFARCLHVWIDGRLTY